MLDLIDNPIPWPDGKKCAVAFTWDMDADSSLHLYNPGRADTMIGTASLLRYGPKIAMERLMKVYKHLNVKQTFFLPGWCIERYPEAVDLLLGAPLPSPGFMRRGAYALDRGGIAIEYGDDPSSGGWGKPPVRERFDFDEAGRLRGLYHWNESGALAWKAEFDHYRDVSGSTFAFEIVLEFPIVGARAQLSFDSVAFVSQMADELFVLREPKRLGRTEVEAAVEAEADGALPAEAVRLR